MTLTMIQWERNKMFPLLLVVVAVVVVEVPLYTNAFQASSSTSSSSQISLLPYRVDVKNRHDIQCNNNNKYQYICSKRYLSPSSSSSSKSITTTDTKNVESTVLVPSISSTTNIVLEIQNSIQQLKKVLQREYVSFFNPMETEWYNTQVTFNDPLTNLVGIQSYVNNVNMLSGRTLVGTILFGNTPGNARIGLHTISGGIVSVDNKEIIQISNIITRWTLQFTFNALPWKPTPRFSGISVYTIVVNPESESTSKLTKTPKIQIIQQDDYWDSINLVPITSTTNKDIDTDTGTLTNGNNNYVKVDKTIAIQHFISLVLPNSQYIIAKPAGPELPYVTVRIGRSSSDTKPIQGQYEVRKYPQYIAIQLSSYTRRDEAFTLLGSLTQGFNPIAPAFVQVGGDSKSDKTKSMRWPLRYEIPGDTKTILDTSMDGLEKLRQQILQKNGNEYDGMFTIVVVPEQVVAVGRFSEFIVESIVRKVNNQLLTLCTMDGLVPVQSALVNTNNDNNTTPTVTFAQYDAVYSMGQRRSEVHIVLDQHPW